MSAVRHKIVSVIKIEEEECLIYAFPMTLSFFLPDHGNYAGPKRSPKLKFSSKRAEQNLFQGK